MVFLLTSEEGKGNTIQPLASFNRCNDIERRTWDVDQPWTMATKKVHYHIWYVVVALPQFVHDK